MRPEAVDGVVKHLATGLSRPALSAKQVFLLHFKPDDIETEVQYSQLVQVIISFQNICVIQNIDELVIFSLEYFEVEF